MSVHCLPLGLTHSITNVTIYNRADCCMAERLINAELRIGSGAVTTLAELTATTNAKVATFSGVDGFPVHQFSFNPPVLGRWLSLLDNRESRVQTPATCEPYVVCLHVDGWVVCRDLRRASGEGGVRSSGRKSRLGNYTSCTWCALLITVNSIMIANKRCTLRFSPVAEPPNVPMNLNEIQVYGTVVPVCNQTVPAGYTFQQGKDVTAVITGVTSAINDFAKLAAACDLVCDCKAINTNGWLKPAVSPVAAESTFTGLCQGLLVRTSPPSSCRE
jgi:hypothetical protein